MPEAERAHRPRPRGRELWFLPVPFLFYLLTTAPGIGHADQAVLIHEMQRGVLHSGASYHNLTVLTGYVFLHLLPFGEPAYRCNLVSTVYGSLAVALFYLLALKRTGRTAVAAVGASLLMTSHSMWWHSTIAEVYAANALLFIAALGALEMFDATGRPRWLDLACVAAGLGLFNHAQMGMWLPGLLLVALLARFGHGRPRGVLRMALAYAIGLVPYGVAVLADVLRSGDVGAIAAEAGGGQWTRIFFTFDPRQAQDTLRLFAMQWGWPSLVPLLFVLGVGPYARALRQSCAAVATLVAVLVNTAFFAGYPTWDKYAFLLPTFVLVTWVSVLGLDAAARACGDRRTLRLGLLSVTAVSAAWPVRFFAELPQRAATSEYWSRYGIDPLRRRTMTDGAYLSNPDKAGYRTIERFARAVLDRVPAGALVIDHPAQTFYQFLFYYQGLLHERPDLVFRGFVQPAFDPAQWTGGLDGDHVVAAVTAAVDANGAYATSLAEPGFEVPVAALLERGIVFVEVPLGGGETVFQAARASTLDLRRWVDAVTPLPSEPAAGGVVVRWAAHNPPLLVSVSWTNAHGDAVDSPPYRMRFHAPPTRFSPPRALAAGRWTARVQAFGQVLGATTVDVGAEAAR